jgi:hypothetical protein
MQVALTHDPVSLRASLARCLRRLCLKPVDRSHHPDPGQHRRAVALGNEQHRLHRGSPFVSVVFGLGQFRDVERGVAQRDREPALQTFIWKGRQGLRSGTRLARSP